MTLPQRAKDGIDLVALILLARPVCPVVVPFAWDHARTSRAPREGSGAANGPPARYVISTIAALGLSLPLASARSLLARRIADPFGPPSGHCKESDAAGVPGRRRVGLRMQHIHLGTIPFVLLQLTAVGVVMAFLKFAFWWPLATGFLE